MTKLVAAGGESILSTETERLRHFLW
jgi:hypothetical protein